MLFPLSSSMISKKKTATPSISCVHFKCQNQHIRDKYFVAALSLSQIMIGLVRILLRITLSSADLIAFVCGFVWRCRYYYGYCTYANIYIHYLLCLNMHYNHHQQSSTTLASSSPSLRYYYVSICILVTTYQLLNVFIICNLEFYIILRFSCKRQGECSIFKHLCWLFRFVLSWLTLYSYSRMSNSQFQMNLLREINAIFKFHTSESNHYTMIMKLWKNYGKNSIWTNYA